MSTKDKGLTIQPKLNKHSVMRSAMELVQKNTRYDAIDEVNASLLHLEQRHNEGKLCFLELCKEMTALKSRIMNIRLR